MVVFKKHVFPLLYKPFRPRPSAVLLKIIELLKEFF
jgi:hypothetical protein